MEDRIRWHERYVSGDRADRAPSPWVVDTVLALPNAGLVLDVAGGSGRHAIPIARAGRRVVLLDFVEWAVRRACAAEPSVFGVVADVAALPLRAGAFSAVVVVNFLDRDLAGSLAALLAPGGVLVYETYTRAHLDLVRRGLARGPTSAAYLAEPAELRSLFPALDVVAYREEEVADGAGRRHCARLAAARR
jgi:SAM-dependent methyltransferase